MIVFHRWAFWGGLILLVTAASTSTGRADEVDFPHQIVPILKQHCAECHTKDRSEGGFSFNNRRLLLESEAIDLQDPANSRLLELIRSRDVDDQMPPADRSRVPAEHIRLLERWVVAGVPWEGGFTFAGETYEPPLLPREVTLPPPTDGRTHPVDRLLHAYFRRNQISASERATDRVFLRRVYLDLIGLPPTRAEQSRFYSLPEDTRRTQIINELLSRRHDYAEHWLTFWNDLLRNDYAGTGYIDGGRKQISVWLYQALLENRPYDQFVAQLIAPTEQSTGFIDGIKWRGNVNASQVREIQFAQSVSQVFLGINMKCASCHDSFIDRWTLDEAYGLAAIYSERELEIHRCDKPTGRIAKAAWIFPELGQVNSELPKPERLHQLAALMTSKQNGRFARTIVNRLWQRLFGRGIVHPVDAMHTPPWDADLLDYLANYLVEQKYDLKQVLRHITTSETYQARSVPATDPAAAEGNSFRGPEARHLTAEQLIDSIWRITQTGPQKVDAPIPASLLYGEDLPQVETQGKWIWAYPEADQSPAGEEVIFRLQFDLSRMPREAVLVVTCDNEYSARLNGQKVGADKHWQTVELHSITNQVKVGSNELRVTGRNAGNAPNAAGLYAEVVLLHEDDRVERLATGESWEVQDPNGQGSPWKPARPVRKQDFLGDRIVPALQARLAEALLQQRRPVRAALLRSNLLMRSLGRPNREQIVTTRPAAVSTLQAIDLANGENLDSMLRRGAEHILQQTTSSEELADRLFRAALSRPPTSHEQKLASALLGRSPSVESTQDLMWLLVMLPEFQFVR